MSLMTFPPHHSATQSCSCPHDLQLRNHMWFLRYTSIHSSLFRHHHNVRKSNPIHLLPFESPLQHLPSQQLMLNGNVVEPLRPYLTPLWRNPRRGKIRTPRTDKLDLNTIFAPIPTQLYQYIPL